MQRIFMLLHVFLKVSSFPHEGHFNSGFFISSFTLAFKFFQKSQIRSHIISSGFIKMDEFAGSRISRILPCKASLLS